MMSNSFRGNLAEYGNDYASFPAYISTPEQRLFTDLASGQQLPYILEF